MDCCVLHFANAGLIRLASRVLDDLGGHFGGIASFTDESRPSAIESICKPSRTSLGLLQSIFLSCGYL